MAWFKIFILEPSTCYSEIKSIHWWKDCSMLFWSIQPGWVTSLLVWSWIWKCLKCTERQNREEYSYSSLPYTSGHIQNKCKRQGNTYFNVVLAPSNQLQRWEVYILHVLDIGQNQICHACMNPNKWWTREIF